jgi:hypothetical protein
MLSSYLRYIQQYIVLSDSFNSFLMFPYTRSFLSFIVKPVIPNSLFLNTDHKCYLYHSSSHNPTQYCKTRDTSCAKGHPSMAICLRLSDIRWVVTLSYRLILNTSLFCRLHCVRPHLKARFESYRKFISFAFLSPSYLMYSLVFPYTIHGLHNPRIRFVSCTTKAFT